MVYRMIPGGDHQSEVNLVARHTGQASLSAHTTNLAKPGPLPNPAWHSRLSVLLRNLSLKLIPSLSHSPEKPKIAIRKSRRDAVFRCLVHLVPLSGALTLIVLNLQWYYISASFPSGGQLALQFAAKLLEITMMSSLAVSLLSYIQYELTSDTGLPFGAAFVTFQITQLTYLWSSDFWGSLRSKNHSCWAKTRLILAIFVAFSLSATLGPASAACMIPRERSWPGEHIMIKGTFGWSHLLDVGLVSRVWSINTTFDDMFPVHTPQKTPYFDPSTSEPHDEDSLILALNHLFQALDMHNAGHSVSWFGLKKGNAIALGLSLNKMDPRDGVTTSMPNHMLIEGAIQYFSNHNDPDADVEVHNTMDSYSKVKCSSRFFWILPDAPPVLEFQTFSGASYKLSNYITESQLAVLTNLNISSNAYNISHQDMFFVDLAENYVGIVNVDIYPVLKGGGMYFAPCTFELGWSPSSLYVQESTKGRVFGKEVPSASAANLRKVVADKGWLEKINPPLNNGGNTTLYSQLMTNRPYEPELFNSAILTVALSNASPSDFRTSFPPSADGDPGFGGFPMQLPLTYTIPGYGYGPDVVAVQLSLSVLLLYCMVTVAHIVWSIWTGISFSAWDSISEVVALAINSRPARELQNTCAGIQTMDVFATKVRIARTDFGTTASGIRHLELLFPSGDGVHADLVQYNETYGAIPNKKEKNE